METFHGTKTEAKEYYEKRATEFRAKGPGYAPPGKVTVGEWLQQWLDSYGREHLEASTYRSYETLVRRDISPYLGHMELGRLSVVDVQRWQAQLAEKISRTGQPLSPRRRAYARQVLRAALNEARRLNVLTHENPVALVRPPKQHPKQAQSFSREQMRVLDAALAEMDEGMALIPTFAWQTGMLLGEILVLRWGDIDWDGRMVSVQRALVETRNGPPEIKPYPKTSKSFRTLRLHHRLLETLRKRWQAQGDQETPGALVFARPDGRLLGERTVETFFERVRDGLGLPHYSFHSLRHTFASLGLQAGIDIVSISKMLGHKSFAFTAQTYAHVLDATLQAGFDRFDRLIDDE
jgi:integrase